MQGRIALCISGLKLVPGKTIVQQLTHSLTVLSRPVQCLFAGLQVCRLPSAESDLVLIYERLA